MIPVSLSIKGLYSYRERQEIDFHSLTTSQLFGIFGQVGSGKSSILEAIMFILFDQSDRLNAKDNRYYNMLNLQSNEMEIDFVFRAGSMGKEQYRFYFSARRKKKDFEKVELKDRNYYQWQRETWMPLANGDVTSILGMSYQNFMQTIIIPQGKFREFIDHTPTHRTRMLKELFHLERFDLSSKTKQLIHKATSKKDQLEGELKGIGEVNPQEIEFLEKEIERVSEILKGSESKLSAMEKEQQELHQLKTLFQKLEEEMIQLQHMLEQQPYFDARQARLQNYEKAFRFFSDKFKVLEEALQQSKDKRDRITQYQQEILKKETEQKQTQKSFEETKKEYDKRDTIRKTCDELAILIEIKKLQGKGSSAGQQLNVEEAAFQQLKVQKENAIKQRNTLETKIIESENKLGDGQQLTEVSHWHKKQQELQQELLRKQQECKQYREKQQAVVLNCEKYGNDFSWISGKFSFENTYQKINAKTEKLHLREEAILPKLRELQVKQQLTNYAAKLAEGDPCPLCGATHHPQVVHAASNAEAIKEQENLLEALSKEKNMIASLEKNIQAQEQEYKVIQLLLEKNEAETQQMRDKILQHQQAFRWESYQDISAAEITKLLDTAAQQQKALKNFKAELHTLRTLIDRQEKDLDQKQKQLEASRKSVNEIDTTIQTKKDSLQLLPYGRYEKHTEAQLADSLGRGEQKYQETAQHYEKIQEQVNVLNLHLNGLKVRKEAEESNVEELLNKITNLDQDIRRLCSEQSFANPEEVKQLLHQSINIEAERSKIEGFKEQLQNRRGSIQQLQKTVQDKVYDEQYHLETGYQIKTLKAEVEEKKENLTQWRMQIADHKKRQEKLAIISKELDQVNERLNNLYELNNLFRGSGFVSYASHIYLSNLCKAANERFFKLTKSNLSLELNVNNEFIVRDYLNNGKTRLLKTLSGGQTFQAALCLALALAENVKSLNKAEQSFFFLDEGFGALDKESLRIVFDTLKSLQKENRIVGIISHVEELQQEIDVFLKVENDREKGSIISCSWQ